MDHPRRDILGIGIAAVDDILTVEKYPPVDAKVPVLESRRQGGGLTCTAVAAAVTLGARGAFVGHFGTDDGSRYLQEILKSRGVDVSATIRDAAAGPYHSRIIIDRSNGRRTIFHDGSCFKPVAADEISAELLATARVLLTDATAAPGPVDLATKARQNGTVVVLDVESQDRQFEPLLRQVDHLVVPAEFARLQTGEDDIPSACATLAALPRTAVVVTAGGDGCWWADANTRRPIHRAAFTVEAVDTNGCGDTFHGAYGLAVARGLTIAEAVAFASACGALKAGSSCGGWDALPAMSQAIALLRQRLCPSDPLLAMFSKLLGPNA